MQHRQGFYEKYVKRLIDIVCSLVVLVAIYNFGGTGSGKTWFSSTV